MIGNLIEKQFTFTGDWGFGSAISIVLIVIMIIFMVLPGLLKKNKNKESKGAVAYEKID